MDKKDMVNVIHIHLKWVKEPSDPSQQWKQSKSCKAHGGCPPDPPGAWWKGNYSDTFSRSTSSAR